MITRNIDWTYLDPSAPAPLQVGDIVSAAAGGLPIYRVTGLQEGHVWVSPDFGADPQAVAIETFHWKARANQ